MIPLVSVVVPAFREAANLEPLVRRVFDAMQRADLASEIIIVDDDSRDGSVEIVERLAREFPIKILVRRDARGLASAVLHGFNDARGGIFVVMDADLQHPPEAIPSLVEPIAGGVADMVVGSRYVRGGSITGRWSLARKLNSLISTALARPLVRLTDPMSGFCALRREAWTRAERLDPLGFKIVLELAVKSPGVRLAEVPIAFAPRHAGQSKLTVAERIRYLRHIAQLYRHRWR